MNRYPVLEQHLRDHYGMDPDVLGPAMIDAAVARRIKALGLSSPLQYISRLMSEPKESACIIEELVVPETWFYRYPKAFEMLSQQAAAWLGGSSSMDVFTVLSAPCSTGEEPWSIAICLLEAGLLPSQIRIQALDVSADAVSAAKAGKYGPHSFRGEVISGKTRYLHHDGKGFVIDDSLRPLVHFKQANLLTLSPPSPEAKYNALFCRNVMIYLTPQHRKKLAGLIASSIKPGGLVFSGHSENFALLDGRFRPAGPAQSFCYRFDPNASRDPATVSVGNIPAAPVRSFGYRTGAFAALAGTGAFKSLDDTPPRGHTPPAPEPAHAARLTSSAPVPPSAPEPVPKITLSSARELADAGRLADALIVCEALLQQSGPDAETYVLLGVLHEALGDHDRAHRSYERAVYLDHRHYEALIHLALLAQRRGDASAALNYNRRAAQASGQSGQRPGNTTGNPINNTSGNTNNPRNRT
jgi:chemotaxis protein methyltransferase WspC